MMACCGVLKLFDAPPIDQEMLGSTGQTFHSTAHRQQARMIDIDLVDLLDLNEPDGPGERLVPYLVGKPLPGQRVELF